MRVTVCRGGRRRGGDFNREPSALALRAFAADLTAVTFRNPFADGESKAGAAGRARSRLAGAVEALEDVRQILRVDAGPGIRYLDDDLLIGC